MAKILVVDDEQLTLEMLSTFLKLIGHQAITALSARQTWDKLAYEEPDLVLLDIMLPDDSGLEICRKLRLNEATKTVPIIMISVRATKNRFGAVDELGVFEMTARGLVAVANPSAVFLAARASGTSGSAVTALMEGTRPVLVEVQALAAPSGYGTPQRVATGLDQKRLAVILAVLERRAGASFAALDVFVQVTAGVRLSEPGADLAVAAALLSSMHDRPTPANTLYLGEVGLGGEIRPIGGLDRRLAEAARLGFNEAWGSDRASATVPGIRHRGLSHVDELVRALAA